ncbi:AAA-like domain-containing protein [Nostocaceae cyanobacterium CENA357]|uniref:AAA-like domain-containing protein n=1 Tax=Atlanticothrix silvestris CENA357 TaxID=1725252 RepID=A0A8J7H5U5_9CYAN|nr:AAA-like domain-containing protein [Atlanticothrix silvestris]MBH8551603.1 AAA-like domain-containing protein [Atlanticothrix silvestris CENA357]
MSNDSLMRILFLTAEPTDTARLRLQQELRDIQEQIQRVRLRDKFVFKQQFSARPGDISQAILDFEPHIVHFSGHGASTGELCFENDLGQAQPVKPEALAALFKLGAAHINCVVLNACYSDLQAQAIVQHISFVIGMNKAIGDRAAISFAVGFYKALGANRSPEEAYEFGCVEIQLQGIPEESTPVLRKKVDQSPAVFHLERPAIERCCYEDIQLPGSLIRIKASMGMGKTWLMNRIVAYARGHGYKTVTLSFKGLIDETVSQDVEKFLRAFCVAVGNELDMPNKLSDYWDNQLTHIFNTTIYFQRYLLANLTTPLVLALNDVDLVFEEPVIANDFCKMLRNWHDRAKRDDKNNNIWQDLRLIAVHSTEFYASLDINSSPLANVGLVIELPEFSPDQVQHLVKLRGLNLTASQIKQLINLLGGHPLLIRKICDYLRLYEISFKKLLEIAPTLEGPFRNHLIEHLENLDKNPQLKTSFLQILKKEEAVQLPPNIARTLKQLGLVKLEGNFAKVRCNLYYLFFKSIFNLQK